MRALNLPWILSGLLCVGACEGTSTGNPTQDPKGGSTGETAGNGGLNGPGDCKETSSMAIAADAQTALGFRASDVLGFVEGTHTETLTWHDQAGGFDYGPESGEHALTLVVTKRGAPRLVHYTTAQNGRGEIALAGGSDCSDAIEIDVTVTISTDQGALNETFETTIVARNDTAVSLYTTLDPAKLKGSFMASNLAPGYTLAPLALSIQLTKYNTLGSLRATIEQRGPSVSSAGGAREPLASWGPEDCEYHGTPVPTSAVVDGFSGDDVLALLNRAPTATVAFNGSAASTATLSFSAASRRACAALGNTGATIGGTGTLYVQAALRIKSADGRIDATWPVAISTTPDANGAIEQVRIAFDDEKLPAQGSLAARYGISGIDASAYDSVFVQLTLAATNSSPLQGELEVTGFTNVACAPVVTMDGNGGSSSSGCAGAMRTSLAHANITAMAGQ